MRIDGRKVNEIRPVTIERGFTKNAAGSVLIQAGNTKIICTASVEDKVPIHVKGTGAGWVTAEYSLLPGSTHKRVARETGRSKISGRTQEIQRLIGRSMRNIVSLPGFGERTIWIDCDVIQADGGTRTIAITGAYIALVDAFEWMKANEIIATAPLLNSVSAISVGIVNGECMLDLCYDEDRKADVDMNIVATGDGEFIEIQGTGEKTTFTNDQLLKMLEYAKDGINELNDIQQQVLNS